MASRVTRPNADSRKGIIESVTSPLRFFVLIVLVAEAILGIVAGRLNPGTAQTLIVVGMLLSILLALSIVALMTLRRGELLDRVDRKVTLILVLPPDTPVDVRDLEWDELQCFCLQGRKKVPVTIVPSGVGPSFHVHLPSGVLDGASDELTCELRLTDMRGVNWKVGRFYVFQNQRTLAVVDRAQALKVYGGES